jgi:hypothetical protein
VTSQPHAPKPTVETAPLTRSNLTPPFNIRRLSRRLLPPSNYGWRWRRSARGGENVDEELTGPAMPQHLIPMVLRREEIKVDSRVAHIPSITSRWFRPRRSADRSNTMDPDHRLAIPRSTTRSIGTCVRPHNRQRTSVTCF